MNTDSSDSSVAPDSDTDCSAVAEYSDSRMDSKLAVRLDSRKDSSAHLDSGTDYSKVDSDMDCAEEDSGMAGSGKADSAAAVAATDYCIAACTDSVLDFRRKQAADKVDK